MYSGRTSAKLVPWFLTRSITTLRSVYSACIACRVLSMTVSLLAKEATSISCEVLISRNYSLSCSTRRLNSFEFNSRISILLTCSTNRYRKCLFSSRGSMPHLKSAISLRRSPYSYLLDFSFFSFSISSLIANVLSLASIFYSNF